MNCSMMEMTDMLNREFDSEFYKKYDVKRGLRDKDGKGVLTGLTEISGL